MNSAQLLRHRKGLLIVANHDRNICERRGRLELSKRWPDGSRFRRPFPNLTAARSMRSRIEAAIAEGTWRELKDKLALTPNIPPASTSSKDLTLREYAPIYLAEMRRKNRRADFHEIQIHNILPILGEILLKDIRRPDALRYRAKRSEGRVAATVNRGVAVLRGMLSQAIADELIPGPNPLFGFEDYAETERELQIPTIEEERAMVTALLNIDLAVGVYAGFMGETAIRTEEALRLKWSSMDVGSGIATVPAEVSKTKQARHIPMSPFCKELLGMLPRVTAYPQMFVRTTTLKPVKDTRGAFSKARERTGLDIYPETFRHFRITKWMSDGVDPVIVQTLAGHTDIRTTRRYAHFAPSFAAKQILTVQADESVSLRQLLFGFEIGVGPKRDQSAGELERLLAI
jgi:integrase